MVVINDLDSDWQGPLTLRLSCDGKTVFKKTRTAKVAALGREVFHFGLSVPATAGLYRLTAELRGSNGQPVRSLRDFAVAAPTFRVKP